MGDRGVIPVGKGEWIKYLMENKMKGIAKSVGDHDGDGKAGTVKDYVGYYLANKSKLLTKNPHIASSIRFYDATYSVGDSDLVQTIISIAASVLEPAEIKRAYTHLTTQWHGVHAAIKKCKNEEDRAKTLLRAVGPNFTLLTRAETRPNRVYDEAIVMAASLAKSFGLKGISAVVGPKDKLYLRYKKAGGTFYMDAEGKSVAASVLKSKIAKGVEKGVYLEPLGRKELVGMMVMNRGYSKIALSTMKDAYEDFIKSTIMLPKSPLAWKNMGNLYGMATEATKENKTVVERYYTYALQLDPEYAPALINLALLERDRGNIAKAVGYLQRVLWRDPQYPNANVTMCNVMVRGKRDLQRAMKYCDAGVRNHSYPDNVGLAYLTRAEAKQNQNPNSTAFIEDLTRAVEEQPGYGYATFHKIGMFMARDGFSAHDYAKVKEHIDAVLYRDPNNFMMQYLLGMLRYKNGDITKAAEQFKKTIDINPNNYAAYSKLAKIYFTHFDDPQSARDLLDEAIAISWKDKDAEVLFDSGVVNAELGKYADAFEDLIDVLHEGADSFAYDSLGVVAHIMNETTLSSREYDLAYDLLSLAIQKDPANKADYYYYRAEVQAKQGDEGGAMLDLVHASKQKPVFHYPIEMRPVQLDMGDGGTSITVH